MSDQRLLAIQKAQRIRHSRAALREECRELGYHRSAARVADILTDGPPAFLSALLTWDLLRLYWRGRNGGENRQKQIKRLMAEASIDPWTAVRDLTERQRLALAAGLRQHVQAHCTHDATGTGHTRLSNGMRIHEIVCEGCGATLRVLDTSPYHPERIIP